MKIEIFYDTVCSWCRVGKVNFKKAADKLAGEGKINKNELEIVFRSYVLYPDIPEEGLDYQKQLIEDDDLEMIDPKHDTPVHRWGKRVGMEFNFEKIKIKPNTYKHHQFFHLMGKNHLESLINDVHLEYFENGGDINGLDLITNLASKYIPNAEEIKARVLKGEGRAQVDKDIEIAESYNIDLVPLYVFDGKVKLEGAIMQKKFEDALLGNLATNMCKLN